MPGPPELIIILVIVLLLFGAKRLPGLANSLGRSIKEFRQGSEQDEEPEPEAGAGDTERPSDTATS
jgi:sec-independent protein translocase protein TatA